MATTIADLLTAIRYRLVDPDKTDYSDAELTSYLKDAHKAIYMTVAQLKPELVRVKEIGNTVPDTSTITLLGGILLSKVALWIEGQKIPAVNPEEFSDNEDKGRPTSFWTAGFEAIELYPVPDGEYQYTVKYVPHPMSTFGTESPWPSGFDPFLVEFTVARAGLRNEADMTQEAGFMANWQSKLVDALGSVDRGEGIVRGYW